jgi:hypothetical protein
MAEFFVRNSLNPYKTVKLGATFRQMALKDNDGELFWLVEVKTNEPDVNGNTIPPEYIHLTSLDNLDQEIQEIASVISSKIDWSPFVEDTRPPYITAISPSEYLVDIDETVIATIKESLPSAGIDADSITMTVNGIDVTAEIRITGDPYEYTVKWDPPARVRQSI